MKNKTTFDQSVLIRANLIIFLLSNLVDFISSINPSLNNHQFDNQINRSHPLNQFNRLNRLNNFNQLNQTVSFQVKENDSNQSVNVQNFKKLPKHTNDDSKMNYQASYHRANHQVPNYEQNYRNLKANIHNQIKSNIRLFNNRKFVRSSNRRHEDSLSTTGEEETNKDKYDTGDEKYSNNEDDDSKRPETDYDDETKVNKDENTEKESKQQEPNEKTDFKTYYESPSDTGEEKDYKEDTKEDYRPRKTNALKTKDYDAKAEDETNEMNMSDDDNLKDDEDTMDDKIKDDDEDTFKNEDKLNHSNQDSMKEDHEAIRFSPIPKYSRPFEPTDKLKYNSIEDKIEAFKDNSKDIYNDSPPNEKSNESPKSVNNIKDNSNSKEVNYSIFDLNRINLKKDKNAMDNFEKHEELLIELLKKRFLNHQKRILELKKQEKRRNFLSEIEDSVSLRKLNQEAVKYAMIEKKLNRLINLIQEQQQQRDMNRFISQPPMFSPFLNDLEPKWNRPQFPRASNYNRLNFKPLFGPNVHFYPKNRFSFSRPLKLTSSSNSLSSPESHPLTWSNEIEDYPLPANYHNRPNYSNHKLHYRPKSNYFSTPSYNTLSASNALNNDLNGALNTAVNNALNYPQNYLTIKKYPIYKFIKPVEQSVEQMIDSSSRKSNPFNERLNNLSLNNFSLNLNSLLGGNSTKHSSTPSQLIASILQPTNSNSFRNQSPIKYQYHLLQNLHPSIPLRMFSDRSSKDMKEIKYSKDTKTIKDTKNKEKNVISVPRLGGIMFSGSGYSPNQVEEQ